jgi:hypothetical protein
MVPILAGTFGCRNNCLEYIGIPGPLRNINSIPMSFVKGSEALDSFKNTIPPSQDKYLVDQIFLAQYVYNYVINNTIIHCAYNAYEPFAIKIDPVETGFVGEVFTNCSRAAEIMGDNEKEFERVGAY